YEEEPKWKRRADRQLPHTFTPEPESPLDRNHRESLWKPNRRIEAEGTHGPVGDDLARRPEDAPQHRTQVLERDSDGTLLGGGSREGGRVCSRRGTLVPTRWRHEDDRTHRAWRTLSIVS